MKTKIHKQSLPKRKKIPSELVPNRPPVGDCWEYTIELVEGGRVKALQNLRYTTRQRLQAARTFDDVR